MEANNRAWPLTELEAPTDAQKAEALLAAYASVFHWTQVGTDRNRALGELLLARVHAVNGEAEPALRYARSGFAFLSAEDSQPWEMAFAHAMMADAAALSGDQSEHRLHYERAGKIGSSLDEEDRGIFLATFNRIPKPPAG
jgi:hypothetical protein